MEAPKGELRLQGPESQEREGQKWEYKLLQFDSLVGDYSLYTNFEETNIQGKRIERSKEAARRFEEILNKYGADGWELIEKTGLSDVLWGSLFIFKRPDTVVFPQTGPVVKKAST